MSDEREYANEAPEGYAGERCQYVLEHSFVILPCGLPAWEEAGETEPHCAFHAETKPEDLRERLEAAVKGHTVLNDALLSEADLQDAYLSRARLSGADLHGADLRAADLRWAVLTGADLSGANLDGADLSEVDLSDLNLSGANLRGMTLSRARLSGANLVEADLRSSYWEQVTARGAAFRDAKLYGFRAVDCDFTGAKCTRADFSEYGYVPQWREFGEREFENLYGPFVEMLFAREVPLGAIGVVFDALTARCPQESMEYYSVEARPTGRALKIPTSKDGLADLRQCCEEALRKTFDLFGSPGNRDSTELVSYVAAYMTEAVVEHLRMSNVMGPGVTINEVRGDQTIQYQLPNSHFQGEPTMLVGKIQTGDVHGQLNIADVISGPTVINGEAGAKIVAQLAQARDAEDMRTRLEHLEAQVQGLPAADREAVAQQIAALPPEAKAAWGPKALEFVGDVIANAGGGLIVVALKSWLGIP